MSQNKNAIPVVLAGRDFVVRVVPYARSKRLLPVVVESLSKATKDTKNQGEAVQGFMDKVLSVPYEILSLFIKDLPKDIFEDEENGVTFPEALDAINAAVKINRVDSLKNVLSRLAPMAIQAYQASLSQKKN